jgi:polar amino acid transport system substrate-binding protein
MKAFNIRSRRAALAMAGAALLAPLSGCDSGQPAPSSKEPTTAVDAALRSRLPQDIRDSGVVRVATDASYAPASYFGPDGHTILGFEPDLAAGLGDLLGVRFDFVQTPFLEVLSDVQTGEVDIAISAITDTAEREQQVDFVNYFTAGTSVLVQAGNPKAVRDLRDLCGHVVAVEEGTTQVDLLERSQPECGPTPIRIAAYPTNSDALMELRTGRAAAVLNDYPPAAFLANDPRTRAHFELAADTQYEPGPYGIAVDKEETALRDVLHDALAELMADGDYERILKEWDVTEGALSEASVNAGSV